MRIQLKYFIIINIFQKLSFIGRASYAQENIWIAEHVLFAKQSPTISAYNVPSIFRISSGHLSIEKFLQTIDFIVLRHSVFRTRLMFDIGHGCLWQSIIKVESNGERLYPVVLNRVRDVDEFEAFALQEAVTPIENGVFRCHLTQCEHITNDTLKVGDFIGFTFHHGAFDGSAVDLFLDELKLIYAGDYDFRDEDCLQYIDYAQYERITMNTTESKDYWRETLRGYSWNHLLDLPYDFGIPTSARRSGRCSYVITDVPTEIVQATVTRAEELNVTLLQLTLTCFYIFLIQLSPHNRDACITIANRNRYRPELDNMIGMFVNMLPCRVNFDNSSFSSLTFVDVLHQVQHNLINVITCGYMPYLELLDLHRVPSSNLQFPFLHALFEFCSTSDYKNLLNQLYLSTSTSNEDSCSLSKYWIMTNEKEENQHVTINMFDTDVLLVADTDEKNMDLIWTYSTDLFTYATADMLSKKFIHLLADLFLTTTFKQLETTPLSILIPMADKLINTSLIHQEVCLFFI